VDHPAVAFDARVHQARVGELDLMAFSYGAVTEIVSAPLDDFVTIHLPQRGEVALEHRGCVTVAGPRQAAVFSAHGKLRMRWSSDLLLLVLKVPQALLEKRLRELVDRPLRGPLCFEVEADVAGPGSAVGAAVCSILRSLQNADECGIRGALGAALTDTVVSALLLGQRNTYTEPIFAPAAPAPPRVVRTVIEAVRADPGGEHAVSGLARRVGVSERTLQLAFRRHTGMSPMTYLRQIRLELAREQLLAVEPGDSLTVTEVALNCGFGHTGRFAAAYRDRFGEPPSRTLRC
jgi:AraC-like DNA-binding protein